RQRPDRGGCVQQPGKDPETPGAASMNDDSLEHRPEDLPTRPSPRQLRKVVDELSKGSIDVRLARLMSGQSLHRVLLRLAMTRVPVTARGGGPPRKRHR